MMEHTPETVTTKSKAMTKWGVRLISMMFFVSGISQLSDLIFNPDDAQALFGLHSYMTINEFRFDFMTWVYAYILFYTGVQLLKFDNGGRTWALVIFWPTTVINGIIFVIMLVMFIFPSIYEWFPFGVSPTLPWCNCKVETPLGVLLFIAIAFAFSLIPLYFLLRKDTKSLFQKPAPTGETH